MRAIDADRLLTDRMKSKYYHLPNGDIAIPIIDIENAPTIEPEPHWIPCSERLPEENGQYLITVKYVHVDGYDDIYAEHGEWTDGKWDMFCFGHCGKVENIIAWMPLPEPYREGEG